MIAEALKLSYGNDIYHRYLEKEILFNVLPQILGTMVCSYFSDTKIKNNKLIIKVMSSHLKSNLLLQKTTIIEKINTEIGGKFVDNIVFL